MAQDTQRTTSELTTLLANNTTGAITPQVLRDFLQSVRPSHGALHYTDPGTPTTIATPATFVKAGNTTVLGLADRFSMPSVARLSYDGRAAQHGRLTFVGSVSSVANNQVIRLAIGLNGTPITESIMKTKLGSAGDVQAISLIVDTTIALNDYFELFVSNDTAANNVTIEHGYMSALAFLT